MTLIKPVLHGYLDYLIAAVFLLAPAFLDLTGPAGLLSYALGSSHLVMTLATNFPLGAIKIIAFRMHGRIERILGPALLLGHFLFKNDAVSHNFYLSISIAIIFFRLVSDYDHRE
ncbi:MAG: hypothetical protein ACU83V_14060 [Gammaproteobacteria bacterium]